MQHKSEKTCGKQRAAEREVKRTQTADITARYGAETKGQKYTPIQKLEIKRRIEKQVRRKKSWWEI
jgi:hypothetical protein